jgi:hypothetical protein
MDYDFDPIVRQFQTKGELLDVSPITAGHINDTFVIATGGAHRTRYVLQRINHAVFGDPPRMMANIARVTHHIRTRVATTRPNTVSRQLTLVSTQNGQSYYRDPGGRFWRLYNFIEEAVTYDTPRSEGVAYEAARTFGWFQRALIDLPGPPLHETIRGFHDTAGRLAAFQEVLEADAHNRATSAKAEIEFLFEHAGMCRVLPRLIADGDIPTRIAHNDAKINNVMLDRDTGAGVCVIDLDTVMPGLSIYDFGDLVRTATCPAAEDERDLSKVTVDVTMYEALARGFAAEVSHFLTIAEREHLVFAGKLITFEQFVRFLTDYLAGDVYYKVHRDGHNLDRSRTQMKLLQSILEEEAAMNDIVNRAFQDTER